MNWVLEHLNLVIVIAGAIAWWINQRAREKAGERADYDDDGVPESRPKQEVFEDPNLAERTRKIREEIQRKIAERRRAGDGYTEPARPAPTPLHPSRPIPERRPERVPPQVFAEPPPLVREVAAKPPSVGESRRMAEVLEQQAALAEQLRQAEQLKVSALRRAAFEQSTQDTSVAARRVAQHAMIDDLRDPAALRRAFIAREILGPPVGLR